MAKILIIGGGFAGLIAAERLAESLDRSHQITLLSHSGRFTFYPALVELAFGDLRADEITIDLASKLSDIGVRFVQGELIRLDKHRKKAEVATLARSWLKVGIQTRGCFSRKACCFCR